MVIARRNLIREDQAGAFHTIGRCIRRAWLCGFDSVTGTNYEHRKHWFKNRLLFLSRYFGVEVCGYAVIEPEICLHQGCLPMRLFDLDPITG